MLKLKIKSKLKCKKHPKFNPDEGIGGIKGGCASCLLLCSINTHAKRLEVMIGTYEAGIATVEPRVKRVAAGKGE